MKYPYNRTYTSPAQRMFNRRTRTLLPTKSTLLIPEIPQGVKQSKQKNQETQKHYYDKHAKELPPLNIGDTVRLEHGQTWIKARVTADAGIRSYKVVTEDGREYRRNRKHLKKTPETFADNVADDIPLSDAEENPPNAIQPPPNMHRHNNAINQPIRRSSRTRQAPKYLQDFVRT